MLPETKDLTLQEIEEYYNKKRDSLVSQRQIESRMRLSRMSMSTLDLKKSRPSIKKSAADIMAKSTTVMGVLIQRPNV